MSRGTLAVVGVAVLLAGAGIAGSIAPAAGTTTRQAGDAMVSVSATGQATAAPDRAVVRVAVVATAEDADTVRRQLATDAASVRAALDDLGVPDDRVRTVAYAIERAYEDDGDRRPAGFEGVHAFEVTLANVSRAGPVIDAAVENGADRIEDVRLTLSEERRRAVRDAALEDAMDNARANAEVVADSADLSITGVSAVSTGDVTVGEVGARTLEAAADDAPTLIESGPVTVVASVQVTYNATAA